MPEKLDVRTVLIIDDSTEDAIRIEEGLRTAGRFVLRITERPSYADLKKHLEAADLVILDWNLDEWLSEVELQLGRNGAWLAMEYLREALIGSGLPVVIYTQTNTASVTHELQGVPWKRGMTPVLSKTKFTVGSAEAIEAIEQYVQQEANQHLGILLGLMWKPPIRKAIAATVKEVTTWDNDVLAIFAYSFEEDKQDFALAARTFLNQMIDQHFPEDHVYRFLETHVSERIGQLRKEREGNRTGGSRRTMYLDVQPKAIDDYLRADAFLRYIEADKLSSAPLDTGDILRIDEANGIYGIVITPNCDVVNLPKSTKLLLGQELGKRLAWRKGQVPEDQVILSSVVSALDKASRSDKEEWLLAVPDGEKRVHIVFHFNWVETVTTPLREADAAKYADLAPQTMADKFERFEFPRSQYLPWGNRVARLRSPYLESLMDNYGRHQIRKGVPREAALLPATLAEAYIRRTKSPANRGGTNEEPAIETVRVAAGNANLPTGKDR